MTDFSTAATIAIAYLCFVFFGKLIMQNTSPVGGLYGVKFAYNMVQVMLCSYMCIEALVHACKAGYPVVGCETDAQLEELIDDWTNSTIDVASLAPLVEALPTLEAELVDPSKWEISESSAPEPNQTHRGSIATIAR